MVFSKLSFLQASTLCRYCYFLSWIQNIGYYKKHRIQETTSNNKYHVPRRRPTLSPRPHPPIGGGHAKDSPKCPPNLSNNIPPPVPCSTICIRARMLWCQWIREHWVKVTRIVVIAGITVVPTTRNRGSRSASLLLLSLPSLGGEHTTHPSSKRLQLLFTPPPPDWWGALKTAMMASHLIWMPPPTKTAAMVAQKYPSQRS